MKIFIPIPTGETIPDAVLKSYDMQTVPCEIIPVCTPRINYDDIVGGKRAGSLSQFISRNIISSMAAQETGYVVSADADGVLLFSDLIERMMRRLDSGIRSVGLYRGDDKKGHVPLQCVMMRANDLARVNIPLFGPSLYYCSCGFYNIKEYLDFTVSVKVLSPEQMRNHADKY